MISLFTSSMTFSAFRVKTWRLLFYLFTCSFFLFNRFTHFFLSVHSREERKFSISLIFTFFDFFFFHTFIGPLLLDLFRIKDIITNQIFWIVVFWPSFSTAPVRKQYTVYPTSIPRSKQNYRTVRVSVRAIQYRYPVSPARISWNSCILMKYTSKKTIFSELSI